MMATLDIIILVVVVLAMILGFMKGFIKQLASLLGLVVGLLAAKALYASLAVKLAPMLDTSMTVTQILSFGLIWIVVPLAFALVASVLTKAVEIVALGGLNRLLGAGLGVLKSLILISLLISVIEIVDKDHQLIDQTYKDESVLYEPIQSLAEMFFPVAKTAWEKF